MQEINSQFNSDKHKEFEKLLNAEFSKVNLKEGNISTQEKIFLI